MSVVFSYYFCSITAMQNKEENTDENRQREWQCSIREYNNVIGQFPLFLLSFGIFNQRQAARKFMASYLLWAT